MLKTNHFSIDWSIFQNIGEICLATLACSWGHTLVTPWGWQKDDDINENRIYRRKVGLSSRTIEGTTVGLRLAIVYVLETRVFCPRFWSGVGVVFTAWVTYGNSAYIFMYSFKLLLLVCSGVSNVLFLFILRNILLVLVWIQNVSSVSGGFRLG